MAERKQSKQVREREAMEQQTLGKQSGTQSGAVKERQIDMEQEQKSYSVEETFARIDDLIVRLESPEIGLEQSFQAYEEGMKLLKACNDQIDRVEKKVLALSGDGGFDELGQ